MKMKNLLIDKMNELKQYEAVETGVPCLAIDDVEKMLEEHKEDIENHIRCGLLFCGYDKEGNANFMGTNAEWKKFDDGNF